jgi:hypothetical protein
MSGDKPRKKGIWRVIVAGLLLAGVSNAVRNMQNDHDPVAVATYIVMDIVLTAIAVWLIVSFFRSPN